MSPTRIRTVCRNTWLGASLVLVALPAIAQNPAVVVGKTSSVFDLPPGVGGAVTYTVRIVNDNFNTNFGQGGPLFGIESLQVDSLIDDVAGDLNGQGNCVLPQTIPIFSFYECTYDDLSVVGPADTSEISTVTASGFFVGHGPSATLNSDSTFVNFSSGFQSTFFGVTHQTVVEGDSGQIDLEFLSERFPGVSAVSLQIVPFDGTATNGLDYSFPAGPSYFQYSTCALPPLPCDQTTFTIPILGDTLVEGDETFFLIATLVGDGDQRGETAYSFVTIIDND